MISKPPCLTDEFWQLCIDQRQYLMIKYPHLYAEKPTVKSGPDGAK